MPIQNYPNIAHVIHTCSKVEEGDQGGQREVDSTQLCSWFWMQRKWAMIQEMHVASKIWKRQGKESFPKSRQE